MSFMLWPGKSIKLDFSQNESDKSNGKFACRLKNHSNVAAISSTCTLSPSIRTENQNHI